MNKLMNERSHEAQGDKYKILQSQVHKCLGHCYSSTSSLKQTVQYDT